MFNNNLSSFKLSSMMELRCLQRFQYISSRAIMIGLIVFTILMTVAAMEPQSPDDVFYTWVGLAIPISILGIYYIWRITNINKRIAELYAAPIENQIHVDLQTVKEVHRGNTIAFAVGGGITIFVLLISDMYGSEGLALLGLVGLMATIALLIPRFLMTRAIIAIASDVSIEKAEFSKAA